MLGDKRVLGKEVLFLDGVAKPSISAPSETKSKRVKNCTAFKKSFGKSSCKLKLFILVISLAIIYVLSATCTVSAPALITTEPTKHSPKTKGAAPPAFVVLAF